MDRGMDSWVPTYVCVRSASGPYYSKGLLIGFMRATYRAAILVNNRI